jgi:hypothetical protein
MERREKMNVCSVERAERREGGERIGEVRDQRHRKIEKGSHTSYAEIKFASQGHT